MQLINRLRNFCSSKVTKHLLKYHQHVFMHEGVPIKHILSLRKKSKTLVVVFSGMNPQRASYSYLNILNWIPHNRLHILDDYGDSVLGSYYRGTDMDCQVERAVQALLDQVIIDHKIERVIFCGSSRGGYAALNFGVNYGDAVIIIGAPQYYLGYYLTHRKSPQLLHIVAGKDCTEEDIRALDTHLCRKIEENAAAFKGRIYLHFSEQEHTYPEHIRYLLDDLHKYGYQVIEDKQYYPNHDDVGTYFPPFCCVYYLNYEGLQAL